MARILRDYKCQAHGYFEAWTAPEKTKCPMKGCDAEVLIAHLRPVGLKSDRTKHADTTLKGLAKDFDMTDIKSTREGEHQTGYIKRKNKQTDKQRQQEAEAAAAAASAPRNAAIWGGQGGMNMKAALSGQFNRPVKDEPVSMLPKSVANFTGPKTASYMSDPDNLKIKP